MKSAGCEFTYGDHKVTLETGRVARQATSAVMVTMDDTVILCTVVGAGSPKAAPSFFPLTVNYIEKTYAAGRIPGSFFRREGRPTTQETLTSRLIDRSIRPLFAKGFMNEVQVICTVMSADSNVPPDVPALLGASAALSLSGLPFKGPLASARVGFKDSLYLLNPTYSQLEESSLDMMVAGNQNAVLMVESAADEMSEDLMLGGILFAREQMQVAIDAILQLAKEASKPAWEYQEPKWNEELSARVKADYTTTISEACALQDKLARQQKLAETKAKIEQDMQDVAGEDQGQISDMFASIQKQVIRDQILTQKSRLDGRDTTTVRPIDISVGLLPGAHGSALFTRGETQAIATATLGSQKEAALMETLAGTYKEEFLLHYNFPPFSVGETGFLGGPKRREIGHGHLAWRALSKMLPDKAEFPYTIRVVSEITESNGSSSMATVCGSSLALMDAGIPMKAPVAGVAMGLVLEGERFAVLTDIMGAEDHLGDMDFKVAGTATGITALQMDIKIDGITEDVMEQALKQAKVARMHILEKMNSVLASSREEVASNAPSFKVIKVPVDKIREIIGKGGATIRSITEETEASIDISDDGSIKIYGNTQEILAAAIERIEQITAEVEVGTIYQGTVKSVVDFGAFVEVLPGKQGLVHVSQITGERIENVSDFLQEGQEVEVVVLAIDGQGRVKLSMKDVNAKSDKNGQETDEEKTEEVPEETRTPVVGDIYQGSVIHIEPYGGFVEIMPGVQGLVHKSEIIDEWVENAADHLELEQKVEVIVLEIREGQGRKKIALSIKKVHEQESDESEQGEEETL